MSNSKNQYFELLEGQFNWSIHQNSHRSPVEHPSCEFCRNWIQSAQYDHVSDVMEEREDYAE